MSVLRNFFEISPTWNTVVDLFSNAPSFKSVVLHVLDQTAESVVNGVHSFLVSTFPSVETTIILLKWFAKTVPHSIGGDHSPTMKIESHKI